VFGCRKKMSAIAILDISGAEHLLRTIEALAAQGCAEWRAQCAADGGEAPGEAPAAPEAQVPAPARLERLAASHLLEVSKLGVRRALPGARGRQGVRPGRVLSGLVRVQAQALPPAPPAEAAPSPQLLRMRADGRAVPLSGSALEQALARAGLAAPPQGPARAPAPAQLLPQLSGAPGFAQPGAHLGGRAPGTPPVPAAASPGAAPQCPSPVAADSLCASSGGSLGAPTPPAGSPSPYVRFSAALAAQAGLREAQMVATPAHAPPYLRGGAHHAGSLSSSSSASLGTVAGAARPPPPPAGLPAAPAAPGRAGLGHADAGLARAPLPHGTRALHAHAFAPPPLAQGNAALGGLLPPLPHLAPPPPPPPPPLPPPHWQLPPAPPQPPSGLPLLPMPASAAMASQGLSQGLGAGGYPVGTYAPPAGAALEEWMAQYQLAAAMSQAAQAQAGPGVAGGYGSSPYPGGYDEAAAYGVLGYGRGHYREPPPGPQQQLGRGPWG